jgi:hypothetical protein
MPLDKADLLTKLPEEDDFGPVDEDKAMHLKLTLFWFWPPGGQANNQTGPKFGLRVTHTRWYMNIRFKIRNRSLSWFSKMAAIFEHRLGRNMLET